MICNNVQYIKIILIGCDDTSDFVCKFDPWRDLPLGCVVSESVDLTSLILIRME